MKELHSAPQLVSQLVPLLVTHSVPHLVHASVCESAWTTAPRSDCTYILITLGPASEQTSKASAPS
jgi:hypothetical protein